MEAKQKVPPFLATMMPENEKYLNIGGKIQFIVQVEMLTETFMTR